MNSARRPHESGYVLIHPVLCVSSDAAPTLNEITNTTSMDASAVCPSYQGCIRQVICKVTLSTQDAWEWLLISQDGEFVSQIVMPLLS